MSKFEVGDRVMIPLDEPEHSKSPTVARNYLGRCGTVTNNTHPNRDPKFGRLLGVRYDLHNGNAAHDAFTWEGCLVLIPSDLDQDLLCAIAPLFMKENHGKV